MQFLVDSLRDLPPLARVSYFVHVIDLTGGSHLRWINENIGFLDLMFGPEVGVVSGPATLSEELFQFLSCSVRPQISSLSALLRSTTCLLISEGHLSQIRKRTYLIPVSTLDNCESSLELMSTLISMIASALRARTLDFLVATLGVQPLRLASNDCGFYVCTLRHPDKLYELMPGLADQGASLDAHVALCFGP